MTELLNTKDYIAFFNDIKKDFQTSRVRAALSVNKELILLYWRIGNEIIKRKKELGWGSEVVKTLAQDLKHAFPDIKGFGDRNLVYMQPLLQPIQIMNLRNRWLRKFRGGII